MLINKKVAAAFAVLVMVVQFVAAQPTDLTRRYLEKAEEQYSSQNYTEAYRTINAVMKLNESAVPSNVNLMAQQIYSKMLERVAKERDYTTFEDIAANIERYPLLANDIIQRQVKQVYKQQEEDLIAKRDAEQKAERREQMELYQKQLEQQQKSQQEFLTIITESQKDMMSMVNQTISDLGEDLTLQAENNAKISHSVLVAILCVCGILVIIFIIVIICIIAAARANKRQQDQFDATLRLVAGMQQANNKLLLGGVTDLRALGHGLKSAGSSRWGMDALPSPEMNADEKEELKKLAIDCEELGAKIDQYTNRKNNSKNVSELVYKLSMQLGLNQNTSMIYFCAAMVYDAGFLSLTPELIGADSLTDEQKKEMQSHVSKSSNYLYFVPDKYRQIFEDAATKHHENMDGSGYPMGLKKDEIPQIARLIHVAESYTSLISRRNYKAIRDKEAAIKDLLNHPELYDNDVVAVLDAIV